MTKQSLILGLGLLFFALSQLLFILLGRFPFFIAKSLSMLASIPFLYGLLHKTSKQVLANPRFAALPALILKSIIIFIIAFLLSNFCSYLFPELFNQPNQNLLTKEIITSMKHKNYIMIFITSLIITPIYEEIFFRGILLEQLAFFHPRRGILIVAILFSLYHYPSPQAMIQNFITGLALNFCYNHYKNLIKSIIMHAIINLTALATGFILLFQGVT